MEKNRVMSKCGWFMLSVVFLFFGCKDDHSPITTVKTLVNNSGYDIMLVSIGKSDKENDAYEVWTLSGNIVLKNGEKYTDSLVDEFLVGNNIDLRLYMNGIYISNNLGDRSPQKEENFVSRKDGESKIELIYIFTAEDYQNALKQK